jgi:hypothetical protein
LNGWAALLFAVTIGSALAAAPARAEICQGPRAAPGAVIHGPVLQIPDGASLCVAPTPSASTWVLIELAHPQATRSLLMAAAFGKNATCTVDSAGKGRCVIEGTSLDEELRSPVILKAAASWR